MSFSNNHQKKKNLMKSTTDKPLRFALLGPHRSSKSSILSIITNDKSLGNYYPTLQNSPTLIQFQPKNPKTRALLDVNVTFKELDEMDLLNSDNILLTSRILSKVKNVEQHQSKRSNSNSHKQSVKLSSSSSVTSNSSQVGLSSLGLQTNAHSSSQAEILNDTLKYYDLDYTSTYLFDDDNYTGRSPLDRSPLNHHTNSGFTNGKGSYFSSIMSAASATSTQISGSTVGSLYYRNKRENLNITYKPPITTPILLELIDTPGVATDDLIPFLERSLDSKLASDVLRNLNNDLDGADISGNRARVKPLLVGSGISDLNGSIDGYFLCYSCVPETATNIEPPAYETDDIQSSSTPPPLPTSSSSAAKAPETTPGHDNATSSGTVEGHEPIEILKALRTTIVQAWVEYAHYFEGWENGKEYDIFSLNRSLKNLWKRERNQAPSSATMALDTVGDFENLENSDVYVPPIIVVVTHCDHELASPLLIEEGRRLARDWKAGFIEVSCAFEAWENVEESVGFMIRECIEAKKDLRGGKKVVPFSKKH